MWNETNETFHPVTVEDHQELGRRQAERKRTAVNDALHFPTGTQFDEDLTEILNSGAEANGETVAIALIDCDRFDHINHDFGRDEGDRILIEAGRYIQKSLPEESGEEAFPAGDALTFKVHTRRANKQYPVNSMDVDALVGERLLSAFPGKMKVDVHHPEVMLNIEIREEVYLYSKIVPGPGGMPVGTNGRAQLLLSGGIDSPVAGWMIAKRGVVLDATYFHAPPYTSERAKQKVVDLAKLVARYSGPIRLHVVNFTDIQLAIYERCPHDELTIIMRRYMMKIAERFAGEDGSMALVTGESIGQVASQTIQSLVCTDDAASMPVFRPLIGFDKQDIIDLSLKIGTYDTSIQPFEDCCTIFVAKHPVTKPRLDIIKKSEERLKDNIDELVEKAVSGAETIRVL